jgi:hypothetical protein
MALQRALKIALTGAGPRSGVGVEGVEPEGVGVAVSRRRAGTSVAASAEVLAPLDRRGLPLAKPLAPGSNPQPCQWVKVPAGASESSNTNASECVPGRARPGERRRKILSLAAVPSRDRLVVPEGAVMNCEFRRARKDDQIATPRLRDHGPRRAARRLSGEASARRQGSGLYAPPAALHQRGAAAGGRAPVRAREASSRGTNGRTGAVSCHWPRNAEHPLSAE